MSCVSGNSTVEPSDTSDSTDFTAVIAEMVADQAPRLFAVVMVHGEQVDMQVAAWGMAFDDYAYMASADGKNQFFLEQPENALRYIRPDVGAKPQLIWVTNTGRPK
jgi:hypothetical protein